MAGLLTKINNRSRFPFELEDGQKIWLRPMAIGDHRRIEAIENGLSTALIIGLCLINEDGTPEIPKVKDDAGKEEDDATYALRVEAALSAAEVDLVLARKIIDAITKIGRPDPEDIEKNS